MSDNGQSHDTVAIVGFGYVGTILGVYLARAGFRVVAVESNPDVIATLRAGRSHIREAGLEDHLLPLVRDGSITLSPTPHAVSEARVVILTVGTPLEHGSAPDLSALRRAASDLAPHLRTGQLVIVKSTVPPGTTRSVTAPLLEAGGRRAGRDFGVSYCPERLSEGNAMTEIARLPVVVSGLTESNRAAAADFWRSAGLAVIPVGSLETAELVKLADNVWIDLNIALTNELAAICERLDLDAREVIRAANSLPKGQGHVNFLRPGIGVGGSCLTKDPWFFASLGESLRSEVKLSPEGRRVNAAVPGRVASTILTEMEPQNGKRRKVAVLGYAFKGSTGDTRNTPVREIVDHLRRAGCDVSVFDPWVSAKRIADECEAETPDTLDDCVRGASCIFVAANHPEFRSLTPAQVRAAGPKCVVYDGWHLLEAEPFAAAGISYFSPGNQVRGTAR